MKLKIPNKLIFIVSIFAGVLIFAVPETEPWDSRYGVIVIFGIGAILGFIGGEKPVLWPIGIFVGEVLYGAGSLIFNSGGASFFFPLGLMFLVPFTIPAFLGSFIGFWMRNAFDKALKSTS